MYSFPRRAFTLVELLVVIAIIGTLVGLLLPAVQSAREASRANQCRANVTQLALATQMYEGNLGSFPGYVEELGISGVGSKGVSWVVMLLPFLEQKSAWDSWNTGNAQSGSMPQIDVVICPSNVRAAPGLPYLSYVGNAGYLGNEPEDICDDRVEVAGNGVFFDRMRFKYSDQRDYGPGCCECGDPGCPKCLDPKLGVSMDYVQTHDGTTTTLMFSESLRTYVWADSNPYRIDRKWHFGFCWMQPDDVAAGSGSDDLRSYGRINSNYKASEYSSLNDMKATDASPSSHHPGIVNVAFVAGQVRTLSDRIDPLIYAQLMTSNRDSSQLVKLVNGNPVSEDDMPPLDDSKY